MRDDAAPIVTSVVMPGRGDSDLREPIIIASEENAVMLSIREAIFFEPRLGGMNLHLEHRGEDFVISGEIESEDQRALILDIAARFVPGARMVDSMEMADQSQDFCEK